MPKRTNTFQQVVATVYELMADGATVEESAMLTPIRGGNSREVDILVAAEVGGHLIQIGIEARGAQRPADVGWVEQMKAKHADLPTDKVVLFSSSGFTEGALRKAAEHGLVAVGAEEMSEGEVEESVLDSLRSIWPKLVSLTPERAKVWVRSPEGELQCFAAPTDLSLFLEDGTELPDSLREVTIALIGLQLKRFMRQTGLRDISESAQRSFVAVLEPPMARIDGSDVGLYARDEDSDPPEFHLVERIEVTGRAAIEVREVTLTRMRLGEIRVAYGEVVLQGHSGVVVAADLSGTETISFRLSGANVSTERFTNAHDPPILEA